jgi:hypothetical protein
MKEQIERITYLKEKSFIDSNTKRNEFSGCKQMLFLYFLDESSLGMINTRVSDIGRRLVQTSTIDEKDFPFAVKPGYTFGVSTRSEPK